jgi:tetratricopeptide (TPR) repeat protein
VAPVQAKPGTQKSFLRSEARNNYIEVFHRRRQIRCGDKERRVHPKVYVEGVMDLDAFRQMVAKNPKGFLGRYGLGDKLLKEGGNLEEAVEHLRVAVELDPVHVASHLALGRALVKLGRKEEAKPILTAGINAAASGRSSGGVDLIPEMRALLQSLG